MKKLIILVAAALVTLSASAQQIGIIGGFTSTATTLKDALSDVKAKNIGQFHVGVAWNQPLIGGLAIQPALEYKVKGATIDNIESISDLNLKTGFIEVPVQIQYGWEVINILRPYVFAEPFIGYAVANNGEVGNEVVNNKWDYVKQRFEYGLGIGAGIGLFKHGQLSLRYYWNFGSLYGADIKLGNTVKTLFTSKCSGIELSAAYFF